MRRLLLSLMSLVCAALIYGCSKEETNAEPVSDGFFSYGQFAVGGAAEAEEINAKSLSISSSTVDGEEETILKLDFVSGSLISAGGEELEGKVPAYAVYSLENPARLVIDIDNLAYWDFRRNLELEGPLVIGSFVHSLFGSPRVSMYFQLSAPVRFLVEESGESLTIRMRKQEIHEGERYFVTANIYDEYRSGAISAETDLSPTLSNDFSGVMMISPAFASEAEAEQYRASAMALYPSVEQDQWRIVELNGSALPEYDSSLDYLHAYKTPAARLKGGQERVLSVRVPDGLYLCDLPDKSGFLYSKALADEEGASSYQQLYVMRQDGRTSIATAFEFEEIEQALFSPDGRKLAVLERTSASTHLYVFDADTYELLNDLSEMGFGGGTSAFIWNSLGNIVYAIAGDQEIQLHQFDYSIPDETQRHGLIDRNSVDEGSLGFADGELYFTYATMDEGSMIYRIKPEGGVRKPFLNGGRFAISGDSRYMAIADTSETSTSGDSGNSFRLYEFASGQSSVITDEFYPYDFIWSEDCTKLYYIESRIYGAQNESESSDLSEEEVSQATEVEEDPYPYTLWVYDVSLGQSECLMDLCAPDIFPTSVNTVLYLNRVAGEDEGAATRTAYLLDIPATLSALSDTITMAE